MSDDTVDAGLTVDRLLVLHAAAQATPEGKRASVQARSALKKLETAAGEAVLASSPAAVAHRLDALCETLRAAGVDRKSVSAYKSLAAKVFAWGREQGLFAPADSRVRDSYPPVDTFAPPALHSRHARATYRDLVRFAECRGIAADALGARHLEEFRVRILDLPNGRARWNGFATAWNARAGIGGRVPQLKPVASRRHEPYQARLGDLTPALRAEVEALRSAITCDALLERDGKTPVCATTADLRIGTLLRLVGFLSLTGELDLGTATLEGVLTLANVRRYVAWSALWRDGEEISPPAAGVAPGKYQESVLLNLEMLVRFGIGDHELGAKLKRERRQNAGRFVVRREAAKDAGRLDDYLRTARRLLDQANAPGRVGLRDSSRAVLIRDALLLAWMAFSPHRRAMWTELRVGQHVRLAPGGPTTVSIPARATKPGRRNLLHELPEEYRPLLDWYLNRVRPFLLAGRPDPGHVFLSLKGGPLSSARIYGIVEERCQEVLRVGHNPHQLRKAWANGHALWSGGDFLTASAMLDACPVTLQRHYVGAIQDAGIRRHDSWADPAWAAAQSAVLEA